VNRGAGRNTRAETTLADLIARAQAGEEVVIARNGTPVVRLVPAAGTTERAVIVSGDDALRAYGVTLLW
jgi:prevent-host-death family protein